MKLIRFGEVDQEKPGLQLADGKRIDCSAFGEDYSETFFATDGLARLEAWFAEHGSSCEEIPSDARLGPPIARPSKIICIGLNFSDHAAESGMAIPEEPVVFFKATSSLVGPNDDLVLPRGGEKTDWEVELAVVIGKKASYVEKEQALDYVAGYALHNDYSERHFQLETGGQWVKGKSCDTFAPLGPFLATKDEIADVNSLAMQLSDYGEQMHNGSTSNFIFDVPTVV
ncbi:MAG: fumarylacetoacetate hydrolase family protein, partial [Lacipirellulaceae bacterium]